MSTSNLTHGDIVCTLPLLLHPDARTRLILYSSYCDRECQKIHWKSGHKQECKKIGKNEANGDYVDVDVANDPMSRLTGGMKLVGLEQRESRTLTSSERKCETYEDPSFALDSSMVP